jgi:cytochrome c biogenesis protein CcmG/thiol:disulfide interchange protein DsbE
MKNFLAIPGLFLTLILAATLLFPLQSMAQGEQTLARADLSASTQDINKYQGKVVLLDFWASWCGPCRRSFPWMNNMQAKYGERGLTVVAVNLDQERADADKFLQRYPAQFTLWYDPTGTLAKTYNVEAMPTSMLLDRQGKIISVHRGFKKKQIDAYEQAIKQAL